MKTHDIPMNFKIATKILKENLKDAFPFFEKLSQDRLINFIKGTEYFYKQGPFPKEIKDDKCYHAMVWWLNNMFKKP